MTPTTNTNIFSSLQRIRAMADTGLLYAKDEFDRERYTELREISGRLLENEAGFASGTLEHALPPPKDYPTPKVDVRAFILNDKGQVLLVREQVDGCWTLPGGWADIGFTPAENVIKECREEAGIEVTVGRLLAIFDKKMHPHPPEPYYIYKLMFHCTTETQTLQPGHDVLEVAYFDRDKLPPLSEVRILKSQIDLLYQQLESNNLVPVVD
ncbi:ADP-ribose pyrophosphatase YjhB, NUDIX family [Cnuella takakiae]|uniref:ADP-ribose pyrophosphatase YjhB, NUDIX family n=1 Tax=Cnuella takakiae TaxID=1302690 RepID=A0A1M4XR96_9BACT|nr:NUDIX hydrolase [Cnuella takakiae]OLY92913.1 ADP-ribose pyrophosphatase [Cnuella takakiae]SHE95965.1 ADP-ribose pyrophosphatase YjhB, NUDIX family [Cnuella takakiae]